MNSLSKVLNSNISKVNFIDILEQIADNIKLNKDIIEKANEIDYKYYKMNISINEIINIIENYKKESYIKQGGTIMASYYGDVYVTINVCMQALKTNSKLIISIEDMMLATNKVLYNIINSVLENNNIKNMIAFSNMLQTTELLTISESIDKIICIGNEAIYNTYKKNNIKNIYYYPYNNIEIYCDSKELIEVQYMLQVYAYNNNVEMEVIEENKIENAINMINNYGNGFVCVLLSNNKEHIEKFKENVKSEKIYINENPFINKKMKIPSQYWI